MVAEAKFGILPETNTGQVVWVSKTGDDDTGLVSRADRPFLTIAAAMAAITDAGPTKPYTITVFPGTYLEDIIFKDFVSITGYGDAVGVVIAGRIVFSASGQRVDNLTVVAQPTTNVTIVDAATNSPSLVFMTDLFFNINSSTGGIKPLVIDVDAVTFAAIRISLTYILSSTDPNPGITEVVRWNGSTKALFNSFFSDVFTGQSSGDVHIYKDNSVGTSSLFPTIINGTSTNPAFSGEMVANAITGTNPSKTHITSKINLTGAGGGTGIAFKVDSGGASSVVQSNYNTVDISGFALSYYGNVDNTDTFESNLDTINAVDGAIGTGIFRQNPLWDFYNGTVEETTAFAVTSNGTVVTASIEKQGGGDMTLRYTDGRTRFDSTPAATVQLTPGTDIAPQKNWIFIPKSTLTLTANTTGFPTDEHTPIGVAFVQSAATVQADAAIGEQKVQDDISDLDNNGHLSHLNSWIRAQPGTYLSGMDFTTTVTTVGGSPDNVDVALTSGFMKQLHTNDTFAKDTGSGDAIYVVNDSVTPYNKVTDLNVLLTDANGDSLSGRRFNFVIFIIANENDTKMMINLPVGSYGDDTEAINDAANTAVYFTPFEVKNQTVLIYRLTLRHQVTGGGTWAVLAETDLRGRRLG